MQSELNIAGMEPAGAHEDNAPSELAQITTSVFAAMLGLDAMECPEPWRAGADRLAASVQLTGDWNGAVLIECDPCQACRFAARFLSMDSASGAAEMTVETAVESVFGATETSAAESSLKTPCTVDDVVRDVLGELANMIGGNLKCVLGGAIRLSMPIVVDGREFMRICKAQLRERIAMRCLDGVFWVTLFTRPPEN